MISNRLLPFFIVCSILLVPIPAKSQTLYGIEFNLPPHLWTVDRDTGSALEDRGEVTVVGYQIVSPRGMATDPTTGDLYAVVYGNDVSQPTIEGHLLIRLDPSSASGTLITMLSQGIRDLAFDMEGGLYGVSGGPNNSTIQDSLFEIDKATGQLTFLTALGTPGASNRNHGLGFSPGNSSVLYHRYGATGFETVSLAAPHNRVEIGTNDISMLVSFSMVWDNSSNVFRTVETPGGGIEYSWVTLDPAGLRTEVATSLPESLHGLAFDLAGTVDSEIFSDGFESGDTTEVAGIGGRSPRVRGRPEASRCRRYERLSGSIYFQAVKSPDSNPSEKTTSQRYAGLTWTVMGIDMNSVMTWWILKIPLPGSGAMSLRQSPSESGFTIGIVSSI